MSLTKPPSSQRLPELTDLLLQIASSPAPTFEEHARSQTIKKLWQDLGLNVQQDEAGNLIAQIGNGRGKPLVLAAHLDTVFASNTELQFQHQASHISGPGIGDNAAGLSVLTALAAIFTDTNLNQEPPCEICFLATVGEEGLGDLRGAKYFLNQHAKKYSAFVAVDGYLGFVVDRALGVSRYRAKFIAPGGHSWGNAGNASAIHAVGEAIHELYKLPIPTEPRSSLNVGMVSGGTSVNSIAAQAELLLDLRSVEANTLLNLEKNARIALQKSAKRSNTHLELEQVGRRAAGTTPNASLIRAAKMALETIGVQMQLAASSTDANAAVEHNLPAISFGVYRGGNAHRRDEWVDPNSLKKGLETLRAFVYQYAKNTVSNSGPSSGLGVS